MGRTILWGGRQWAVRPVGEGAPGPCSWSDDDQHVWLDGNGMLHLAITRDGAGTWRCAEVHHERALGFGRYRWRVHSDLRDLDPQAVFGLFTYDWDVKELGAGELDIEIAKWGVAQKTDVEFSIQPVDKNPTARNKRIDLPRSAAPPYDCWFTWQAAQADFVIRGRDNITRRFSTRSVPPAPSDTTWPFMNLWLNRGRAPMRGQPVEAIISSFAFTAL